MIEHTPLHNALTERGFALVMDGSGMNARWRHPDPQVDGLLLSITLAAESAAISVYFADHHADYVRPKYVAILMRLRAMARHGRDPRPSLARLANAIGMKEDAVRQFVRWWGAPQPDDPEWRVMRAYIPFIGAADGKTYRFSVLQGDVPDEATWEIFDRQRAQLRLPLSPPTGGSGILTDMGSENQTDMGSEKESDMGSVFQTGLENRPLLSQKRGLKNRPPSEPCARAHARAEGDSTTTATKQQYSEPDPENHEETAAAAILADMGAGTDLTRELLSLHRGPELVLLFATEVGPSKPRWHGPVGNQPAYDHLGFVITAVRSASRDPHSSWAKTAREWPNRKAGAAPAAAAPQPRSAEPPHVRRFKFLSQHTFHSDREDYLRYCRPLRITDEGHLEIEAPPRFCQALTERVIPHSLQTIRAKRPEFPAVIVRPAATA